MSRRQSHVDDGSSDIRSMLSEMDTIVERLHLTEKGAYIEACLQNPSYAQADALKLRFLRVENYNTGLAVHRMCQYFEFKFDWFGQQLLARPLLVSDLSSEDLVFLQRGDFQLLEQRDAGRRRIAHYICRRNLVGFQNEEVAFRRALFFFLDMIAQEHEDVQVHGINSVISTDWDNDSGGHVSFHHANNPRTDKLHGMRRQIVDPEFLFEIGRFLGFAAPLKVVQLHFVYGVQSVGLGEVSDLLSSITSRLHGRATFFPHKMGSHEGLKERLLSHGLPVEAINLLDEQYLGYNRNYRAFDGDTGVLRSSTMYGHPTGREEVVRRNSSTESSTSYSSVAGFDSHSTNNNLPSREATVRNVYGDSRGLALGALNASSGSFYDARSSFVLDAISSRRSDDNKIRSAATPHTKLLGVESNSKKRKRAGPVALPSTLYFDDDSDHLSPYQCLLRQQIEAFEACSDDVQYNASRMNRGIVLSQVGLRCRHCAESPEWERANGAVYYPGRLDMLYQASQNMAKNHLCTTCQKIPLETRDLLSVLRTDKRRATAGKEYWAQAAQRMGIYEDESPDTKTSRLRFRPLPVAKK